MLSVNFLNVLALMFLTVSFIIFVTKTHENKSQKFQSIVVGCFIEHMGNKPQTLQIWRPARFSAIQENELL